jgi:CRP-like cAMP-binding protein
MVRIFKKKGDAQVEIDTLRAGQIVGEMAFLDGNARSASAEALMETDLVEISRSVYDQTMVQIPEWLKVLLKAIVARLRSTTTKMKNLEQTSSEMDYGTGRRNFIFLSSHDVLKSALSVLTAGACSKDVEPDGKKMKVSTIERYANQVCGIPVAKVTAFLEILRQGGVAHLSDDGQTAILKDQNLLESFVHYVCDENMAEPSKRHDITIRGFLVMGLVAKNLDRFKPNEEGVVNINIGEIQQRELNAAGKPHFRMDEFGELLTLGYASNFNSVSETDATANIKVEAFKKAYRIQRLLKFVEATNEEKKTTYGS